MTEILNIVQPVEQDASGIRAALEIVLRVTVLLMAAMLVVLALRRSSAALRHLVWMLSLIGALLIPLFSWAFPTWQWAILPQRQESPPPIPAVARDPAPVAPLRCEYSFDAPAMPAVTVGEHSSEASAVVLKTTAPSETSPARVRIHRTWSWSALLAGVWALGAFLGVVWLGIGIVGAWYVARRAKPTTDPDWHRILQRIRLCGFRRPVEIRQCLEVSVPMTWGARRPVILVPASSAAWSEATKRSVLLHELGHIRRNDCLMYLLGQLACAAYWFHPLVWLAARQLRNTSEQAADDMVLSANIAPPDYAEHLVAIAGQMRGLHLLAHVALPMASPSDLEGRVCAILDPQRNHRSLNRKTCYALMLVSALLLIPCALLRLGYAQGKNSQQQTFTVSQKAPARAAKPNASGDRATSEASAAWAQKGIDSDRNRRKGTSGPQTDDGSAFRRGAGPAFDTLAPAAFAYAACQRVHKNQRKGEAEIKRRRSEAAHEFRSQVAAHWPYDDPKLEERQHASQEAMKEIVSLFSRAKGGERPSIDRDEALRRILQLAESFPNSPVSDKAHFFAAHLYWDVKPRRRDEFFKLTREVDASTGPLNAYRIMALGNLAGKSRADEQRLQDRQRFSAYLRELHDLRVVRGQLLNPLPTETQDAYVKRVLETLATIEASYTTNAINMKADAMRAERSKAASAATAAPSRPPTPE